jgi:hypothetical protein
MYQLRRHSHVMPAGAPTRRRCSFAPLGVHWEASRLVSASGRGSFRRYGLQGAVRAWKVA